MAGLFKARNLVEEAASSSAAAHSYVSVPEPSNRHSSPHATRFFKWQRVAEPVDPADMALLMATTAKAPQSLVITVSDKCCDEAAQGGANKQVLEALTVSPGTYHIIHPKVNGHPVFRQEAMPGECNDKELFIFYSKLEHNKGYFLTDMPFNTEQEKSMAIVYMFFTPLHDENGLMFQAHCPPWATKPMPGINVTPWALYVKGRLTELEAQVKAGQDALDLIQEGTLDGLENMSLWMKHTVDCAKERKPKISQDATGGRWMPKMAQAMTL